MPTYTRKEGDMVVTYSKEEYAEVKSKEETSNLSTIIFVLLTFPVSVPLIVILGAMALLAHLFSWFVGLFED
jgi:hypothetical protein